MNLLVFIGSSIYMVVFLYIFVMYSNFEGSTFGFILQTILIGMILVLSLIMGYHFSKEGKWVKDLDGLY